MNENSGISSESSSLKWDCLVLTARNAEQREIFQLQLTQLKLVERGFCAEWLVLADSPEGVRIGSGGATLNTFSHLEQHFGSADFFQYARLLLLHSGGLSQRIPHVALTGKAFMQMPDGQTLLEHKLRLYRNFLAALSSTNANANDGGHPPGFVFIASADVLEYFPDDFSLPTSAFLPSTQLLLVAHHSPLEVATQHGVFVCDEQQQELLRVLQKPTEAELRQLPGAILPGTESTEMALTDSCYLLRPALVQQLLCLRQENGQVRCELCCYRDFLCPLGMATDADKKRHFCANNPALFKWQQIIWRQMHGQKAQLVRLGPHSFFHFGTAGELLHHFYHPNSVFRQKFLVHSGASNLVNCRVVKPEKISSQSFLEWCKFSGNIRVEAGCILSGLEIGENQGEETSMSSGMCASTFPVNNCQEGGEALHYVTVVFHRDDDLKKEAKNGILRWFNHTIDHSYKDDAVTTPSSLWECPLFRAQPTATKSLLDTLRAVKEGPNPQHSLLSISEVLNRANVHAMLQQIIKMKNEEK